MEFYTYLSGGFPRYTIVSSFCMRDLIDRAKDLFIFAVSSIIGNVFSAIFTFFFALGEYMCVYIYYIIV